MFLAAVPIANHLLTSVQSPERKSPCLSVPIVIKSMIGGTCTETGNDRITEPQQDKENDRDDSVSEN